MKRWVIVFLAPVSLGVAILLFLGGERRELESELKELRSSIDHSSREFPIRTTRFKKPKGASEASPSPPTLLEEIESLSNVSREELKSQTSRILTLRKGEEFDTAGVKYSTILTLMTELDPEWFLRQLEQRELGVEYHWGPRSDSVRAFEVFLRQDREAALEWYLNGVETRSGESFAKFGLCSLATDELLKTDPLLALEIAGKDSRNFPRFGRLDSFDQLSKCKNLLPEIKDSFLKGWLREFVASETYRLGGLDALQNLIHSDDGFHEGSQHRFMVFYRMGSNFASERGIQDLMVLTQDAPAETRAEVVGHHIGRWGYEDSVAAEEFISSMPPGKTKKIALGRLAECKTEYDPEATLLLLSQIESEKTRDRIRQLVEKRWGNSWVK